MSRINDNLANQVKRWSGFNGVPPVNFDFDAYKLSDLKGDSGPWRRSITNTSLRDLYLNNDKGIPMVALNYVRIWSTRCIPNTPYRLGLHEALSRDQKTGAIQYNRISK